MKKLLLSLGVAIIACLGVFGLTACGPKIADNTEHFDDITKTLKLNKSYDGKNFYTEGIGTAKVATLTDGDTTLFTLDNKDAGNTVNIRYYCIDTPESTGSVEKWGKAASLFVKDRLTQATEIVLEATSVPAVKDSYGTRYLGYVWYKTADYNEFKCLNLEIVENGFSENKAINTSTYPYYDYFKKANDFAKEVELRIYSKLEDPLFSTDPIDITIKEFNENPLNFYNEEYDSGSKVRFNAYLKSLSVSGSGTYTFVAEQYDEGTGETYQLNVYTGYNSSPASTMKIGHFYQIVGSVQKHNGNYQIAGPVYNALYPEPDNTHIKQKNYYWNFDSSIRFTENNSATLYSSVTVASISVDGTVMTITGSAKQCQRDGYAESQTFTFKVNVEAGYTPTLSVGSNFKATAYRFDASSDILTITNVKNIVKA